MKSRFALVGIVVVLVFALVLGAGGTGRALADTYSSHFLKASSDCASAHFSVYVPFTGNNSLNLVGRQHIPTSTPWMIVSAVDALGSYLGDYTYTFDSMMESPDGVIWYSQMPKESVTLTLYMLTVPISFNHSDTQRSGKLARPAMISFSPVMVDQVVIPVQCGIAPGCDVGMVPQGSVMGLILRDVVTSWTPGQQTQPLVVLPAGKTAWVIGVDETGEYYKIVWGCSYLWVDVDAMGPNPDSLWKGAPLPQTVVK